jgi:AcrR family transcriptional regulator
VAQRRQAAIDEILTAAWELAREHGLAGLSLRDLGARVGMKAQSLYSYFPSKQAIHDAMFREGYEQFIRDTAVAEPTGKLTPAKVRETSIVAAYAFFDFCTADPARFQLLFQRTVPGFAPSEESMAVAFDAYQRTVGRLAVLGIADAAGLDLWTAMMAGLASQQLANDPGGTRWRERVPDAVDMLLNHITTSPRSHR